METFKYYAQSVEGERRRGVIEAYDRFDAVSKIKVNFPIVLSIEQVKKTTLDNLLGHSVGKVVTSKYLSVACQQFAIILKAGIPIGQCVRMIADQTKNKQVRNELLKAADDITQGNGVAKSFEKNCPDFPITFFETVRSGEMSGRLDRSFASLSTFYAKSYKVNSKLKSALAYPTFMLALSVVVLIVIMAFVIPKLTKTFTDLGGQMPVPTRILIAMSNFFAHNFIAICVVIAIVVVGGIIYSHSESGKVTVSKIQLKLPIIGRIITYHACEQFSDTMSSMLSSGLMIDKALETTSKVMSNYIIRREIASMVERIQTGHTIAESMNQSRLFPDIMKQMVSVGEATGELEETLKTIGEYYTNEYDQATAKALAKLEPAILVFLSVFAGFIVISIYLPMFTVYDLM
ncbi:MAG: type II secretion system F family protein [Saccharofermentans sp.]|nr:type II secretion system F family protein [Mageeibacillus sp.]MCI1263773.1 type II secretion system F family protein [Saccharofermentans sp.]MCI1274761.1 type II secretion system F family protein [Saccharofermentans sp.]MCI1769191.1 type II secretion system F family protein [Mageeibacillus sp.]MCI2044730.1 type II secretion system F family protein [Mageeibacillus sp.]